MNRTPVDLVKCYYDSLVPGKRQNLMDVLDPDMVLEVQEGFPAGRTRYEGIKAYREDFLQAIYGAIDVEFNPDAYLDSGNCIVALGRMRGRAILSAVPFDVPFVHLWTSDGRCLTQARFFTDTAVLRDAIAGRRASADVNRSA